MEESAHSSSHIAINEPRIYECAGGTPLRAKPDGEGLEGGFDFLTDRNNPDPMLK